MDLTDDARTLYVGNLTEDVTEEILYELFFQVGPLANIRYSNDKDGRHRPYAFVVFEHECSVPYAIQVLDGTILFGKRLNLNLQLRDQINNMARGSPMHRNGSPLMEPPGSYDNSKMARLRGHHSQPTNQSHHRPYHQRSPPPSSRNHRRNRDRHERSDKHDRFRSDRKNDFDCRQLINRKR